MPRDVVRSYLVADGHGVVSATNGRESVDAFRGGDFDLVVTDHSVPSMTGTQLAESIKAEWPAQPILMLTGFTDPALNLNPPEWI